MISVKERTYNPDQKRLFVEKVTKYDWHLVNCYSTFHNALQEIIDETFPEVVVIEDSEDVQIANEFNKHYVTIGKKKQDDIKKDAGRDKSLQDPLHLVKEHKIPKPFLTFEPIQEHTVKRIISSLRNNPELCPDAYGFSVELLQAINPQISSILTKLINKSFKDGVFPNELKLAAVLPYEKKHRISGHPNDPTSFRPVSITSVLSKVFEDAVVLQLREHFENNNLFYKGQHGHRNDGSIVSAISAILSVAVSKLKKGESVKFTMYNFGEEYDSVDREILLDKFRRYGVGEKPIKYLESFINERTQFVRRCGCRSDTRNMGTGIPQGLKLTPLLFAVYVNDLPDNVMGSIYTTMYTEEVCFITPYNGNDTSTEEKQVNEDVNKWLRSNLLQVEEANIQRLVIPHITPETIETVNFLSVILSNDLSWSEHIKHLVENKLASVKESIQEKSAIGSPYKQLRDAYLDFHGRMARDTLLWGHSNEANVIFDLQKEMICSFEHRGLSFKSKFMHARVLTLPSLYIRFCLCHAHNSSKLNINMDLEIYRTEPKYTLTELYNALPEAIRKLDQHEFRTSITNLLSKNAICSMEEFLQKCSEL